MNASRTTAGILCGAGAGALWGLVFLAPELARGFDPLFLTLGRYFFYGLLSAALIAPRWRRVLGRVTKREWMRIVGLALIGNVLYYLFLSNAVRMAGIAISSLVIGFLPVAVTVIGSREEGAVPLRKLAPSLILCMAGAVCIGWQAIVSPLSGSIVRQSIGALCAFGALASWVWFAVYNARWLTQLRQLTEHDWNLLTGLMTGACAIALFPVAAIVDASRHPSSDWTRLIAVAAGVALLASIFGNALWNRMSRLLPLTLVGQMILFETLFALLYGFLWERRLPTAAETAAFACVASSVILCVTAHRRPVNPIEHP